MLPSFVHEFPWNFFFIQKQGLSICANLDKMFSLLFCNVVYIFQYQSNQVYKVLAFFVGKTAQERKSVMCYKFSIVNVPFLVSDSTAIKQNKIAFKS